MVCLPINGIEIDFPYQPYGPQIRYMAKVIDALRSGHNALLESPTGTGKTLCLLCAALAWRATYIAALQSHAHANGTDNPHTAALRAKTGFRPPTGAAAALSALVRSDAAPELSAPRIVFASRTHSQLAQAVGELKKTVYNPGMVMLASRDQLCLHEIATSASGSRLNAMCRRVTAPTRRGCRYHLPVASVRAHENRCGELVDKLHSEPPMDIEDIRAFGSREGACPWFLSRAAARAETCDILFLPYNYLLDRSARDSLDVDWANDIVIIDEAHNLESVCADSMSFDLSSTVRSACDDELSRLIEQGARPGGLIIPALEAVAKTEGGLDSVIGSENRDLLEIRLMRSILSSVEEFVANVAFDRGEDGEVAFKVFPGSELRRLFEGVGGPTADTFELFVEMLDRAMGLQAEKTKPQTSADGQVAQTAPSGGSNTLKTLQTAIRVLFESVARGHEKCFRTVVQQSTSKPGVGRTISYWCFKPAVAMQNIQSLNLRCILLTSGTLSPMDSFATELGIDFPVRLENPHVVTRPQVWAGVLSKGPDDFGMVGGRLTSAFQARGDSSHMELGRTMIRIASIVPDGLLVFFPSYGSLYSCTEAWKQLGPGPDAEKPSIWERLLCRKHIVVEERESAKFAAAILAHRTNVDARSGSGSILLAVCRGKVSEGIDFSDEYGRAVVITGLPYPSAFDPKIVLKREIADEEARDARQRPSRPGNSNAAPVPNGSEWYATQALRAVNQAVGRAIRHRHDYGAILLCDERFQAHRLQEKVSTWIRPNLMVAPSFATAERSLKEFFENSVRSTFAKEGEKKRLEQRKQQRESGAERKPAEHDTRAVAIAQEAISNLLPPPRTDHQFVEQMFALTDELEARKQKKEVKVAQQAESATRSDRIKIFELSAESARGGVRDSGALRTATRRGDEGGPEAPKRSAMFLATRAERIDDSDEEGAGTQRLRARKRIRGAVRSGGTAPRRAEGGGKTTPAAAVGDRGGKVPFSQMIKKLFDDRDVVREFLRMFREILSLRAQMKEGVGPLQTDMQMAQNDKRAKQVVQKLVFFTREKSVHRETELEDGNDCGTEAFLRDLRIKVPSAFQHWYDEALDAQNHHSETNGTT